MPVPAVARRAAELGRARAGTIARATRGDDDDDDNDDDDGYAGTDPAAVDPSRFVPPKMHSFGLNSGRSAPSHRRAVGRSSAGTATVHVCTNCGSEFVKWMGRCPTCNEWNTIKEMRAPRAAAADPKRPRPAFGGGTKARGGDDADWGGGGGRRAGGSWLGGAAGGSMGGHGRAADPVRITDVYESMRHESGGGDEGVGWDRPGEGRLIVPADDEINNVLGGGIMPGSIILVGGDPGVGKSTLLLQAAGALAELSTPPRGIGMGLDSAGGGATGQQGPVLYVSGEESAVQVAARAARLDIRASELFLLSDTDADSIAETVIEYFDDPAAMVQAGGEDATNLPTRHPPCLLVIDSIQTMTCADGGQSAPGGVTQVRECVGLFLRLAKSTGVPIFLVGHVTKAGGVAGPRTVEHMVDAVLYLEGNEIGEGAASSIRMLRAAKNRFGSAEEVGVYSVGGGGGSSGGEGRLVPVSDPSSLFLSSRIDEEDVDGCAVSVVLEGLRPMTVEVQALVASNVGGGSSFSGRRTVDGIASPRLLLILAVLQKRYNIRFNRMDVYVNVVNGIRLGDGFSSRRRQGSDSDLAVAVSLVSSLTGLPVRSDTAFVGEIGLLGELREVPSIGKRVKEARRMGFSRVVTPRRSSSSMKKRRGNRGRSLSLTSTSSAAGGIEWIECANLLDAINAGLVSKLVRNTNRRSRRDEAESDMLGSAPGSLAELDLDPIFDDDD